MVIPAHFRGVPGGGAKISQIRELKGLASTSQGFDSINFNGRGSQMQTWRKQLQKYVKSCNIEVYYLQSNLKSIPCP